MSSTQLRRPGHRILYLNREIEVANRRIRDLETHLRAALRHIANEHKPPAELLAAGANLLTKDTK